ncbi:MAG: protein kinase domain-containing protein, partial [Planctomycetota bacterium]
MASQRDTVLGELALERGYLTAEQLDEAKEDQRKIRDEMGIEESLAQILLGKKWLTEDRANELRKAVAVETGAVRMVGGYEIVARLGRGGMGTVYKARKLDSGEYVALKILPPSLASEDLVARFRREAEITQGLSSDNIVGCVEFGFDKKRRCHFCALEFVKGEDLARRIKRKGKLPEAEAIGIATQMTMALEHAHHNGLVHRDVKPANIMVTRDRKALLLDLGLARPTSQEDVRLTQSGAFVGSASYASPEQARGSDEVDIRSDIYSLGATVYHVVTGSAPFEGETMLAVLQSQISGTVPWPAEITPELSEGLCRVIAKMMAKSPDDRYQTPDDLHRDLDLVAAGEEPEVSERALRNSSVKMPAVARSPRIRRALERAERKSGRHARSDDRREKTDSRRERARRPARDRSDSRRQKKRESTRDRSDSRRQKRESARTRRREKEADPSPAPVAAPVPEPEPQPGPEAKPEPGPEAEPGPEPEAKPPAEDGAEQRREARTAAGRGEPPVEGPRTSRRRKALAAAGVLVLLAGVGTAVFFVISRRLPVEDRNLKVDWGATPPEGKILREWWSPPIGEDSAVLDKSAPPLPTGSELVKSFDGPLNWRDNYNSRIRGFVHAPVSGKYVFRLCSDDDSELWLSRNDNPGRAVLIARIDAHKGRDVWEVTSRPVKLKAGRRYYVEAVHREGAGEDHIRVGWDRPDGAKQWPIPGRFLSPGRDIPRPPVITSTAPAIGGAGVLYRYEIKTVAAPAARITVVIAEHQGLPAWLEFDGKSIVSGTPAKEHAGTASEVTVAATNKLGTDKQVFTVKIIDADPTLV